MPLIVSVSGINQIGVTVACERIYHALRHTHSVKVVNMSTRNNAMKFEDDYLIGAYHDFDVLLVDKHPYIASALNRNLRNTLFTDDSVKPDLSFVMTCRFDTYKQRGGSIKNGSVHRMLDNYATSKPAFFGTDNHHRIACDGNDGRLAAAGDMIAIIRKQLKGRK